MNDYLEIGYWRQRHRHVQRVLDVAERLCTTSGGESEELERQLAAAVHAVRRFDAEEWPFPAPRPSAGGVVRVATGR